MRRAARWTALFALTFGIVALLAVREVTAWIAAGRAVGIELRTDEGGLVLDWVRPDGPAGRAGLQAGDRLLQIDDRPISDLMDYDLAAKQFGSGWARFLVLRNGETQTVLVLPGSDYPWFQSLINGISCLAFLALGLIALSQSPSDTRGQLLGAFSFAVALELAMPLNLIGFPGFDQFAFPFLSVLIGVEIGLELHLAASIPRYQPWRASARWAVPAFYVLGIGLGVFHAASQLDDYFSTGLFPWTLETADTIFWDLGMAAWAIVLVALLARTALTWPEPLGRHQAGLVLTGALPWAVLVMVRIGNEWLTGTMPAWIDILDGVVLLIYPLAIFLAIYRYQLFDLETVVKRGMVYTSLAGTLILLFYGVIAATGLTLSSWVSPSRQMLAGVAIGSLAMGLAFHPLRRALQHVIERRFFPERRVLRARLIRLASQLPAHGSLSSMGKALVGELCEIFRLNWAAVLLSEGESGLLVLLEATGLEAGTSDLLLLSPGDPGIDALRQSERPLEVDKVTAGNDNLRQRLARFGVELMVPLVQKEQLVGLLLLGTKSRGASFPAEEKELLNLLAHHVASVFENAHLFESATHDSLTGLLRREAILDHLDRELRRAARFDRPLTVAMADLDHFKEVNDRFGHLTGDVTLKQVAKALLNSLRESDMVGRYGGEEFLIVLTETELAGAQIVAEKVRRAIQEISVPVAGGGAAMVTLSIGLADRGALGAAAGSGAISLIDCADRALYGAKSEGRNRVGFFGGRSPTGKPSAEQGI
jgi:diguanylate cyclase (GGDEF)-like protein